ncbi:MULTISPECIES: hypothetical protein [unclassified Pseudomonas]|uniref:hypothetical protein n=1 Tax=unclassified Pseudomonas TaxID=196821 RepID=UPI0011A4FE91|nr:MULTISPECIES: hypothetical protein [unclassified Pseudomonas]TWC18362.1 hypothetical protein FBY05_113166 [Pseudomonas sp. SJZ083]TWC45580.1 hypothetical protein FBY01_11326 [Pseudomonas sp. SJZ077]
MSIVNRKYSALAKGEAKAALDSLLSSTDNPQAYSATMRALGELLGGVLNQKIPAHKQCLLASTAEDADYLSKGIYDCLKENHSTKAAVFWNNHYSIPGGSIAPVVHKFLEPGYEGATVLVIAKSIISGSCVVRTNLLELIEHVNPEKIYIVSPVMHISSEKALRDEFPSYIADKFEFLVFAVDSEKAEDGEITPGIGGQVYPLLGLKGQPARVSYMPNLVRELASL